MEARGRRCFITLSIARERLRNLRVLFFSFFVFAFFFLEGGGGGGAGVGVSQNGSYGFLTSKKKPGRSEIGSFVMTTRD